ncbi:MAG: hypothetical protein FWF65_00160 [Bacteroidetes bacterium]|nr:hypothetical protein [Bacteroidota bacterium]
MAAVTRRQFCGKFVRYYPAGSSVKAPPAPSRWTLHASRRQRGGQRSRQ